MLRHLCASARTVFLASALTVVTFAAASAQNSGNVAGLVTDSTSHPIANASVTSSGKSATTGSDGRYTLSNLPVGTKTVTASAQLYLSNSVTVSVVRKKTVTAPTIVLTVNYATVSGSVTNANTGSGIAGASVKLNGSTSSASTDSAGNYSLRIPAGSAQTLTASATGYNSASQTVTLAAGTTGTVNFALTPVTVVGPGSTITWNGSSAYLLGINFAWWNYGTDFGTGGWGKYTDWANIDQQFAAMSSQGVRVIRWWVFSDGRYSPDFNADGTVSGLDSYVLPDLDTALAIAAKYNVYLVLTVADANIFAPASFNGSIQMGGRQTLITNATVRQSYLDNALKPLFQHVAAGPNKNRVLAYDVMNEPELQVQGCWGSQFTSAQMKGFLNDCVSYVHTYGGGAYATVGSAMPQWVSLWKGIGQDFYQLHWYPGFDNGGAFMTSLPTYASLNLDKPCIVGEFATNVTQAQMQQQLDGIYQRGYAGALAWSYWVSDSATNWPAVQPVFTSWSQTYSGVIGPK